MTDHRLAIARDAESLWLLDLPLPEFMSKSASILAAGAISELL